MPEPDEDAPDQDEDVLAAAHQDLMAVTDQVAYPSPEADTDAALPLTTPDEDSHAHPHAQPDADDDDDGQHQLQQQQQPVDLDVLHRRVTERIFDLQLCLDQLNASLGYSLDAFRALQQSLRDYDERSRGRAGREQPRWDWSGEYRERDGG
jgi:hypothetical protein